MICPGKEVLSKAERGRVNIGTRQDLDKKERMGARLRSEEGGTETGSLGRGDEVLGKEDYKTVACKSGSVWDVLVARKVT